MIEPQSFVAGRWIGPGAEAQTLRNPVTGAPQARAGSDIPDMSALVEHAVTRGGPALRAMGIHDRARMLKALAQRLDAGKEALYALNPLTGATRRDGGIDIDGGIGTLFVYASKGRREMADGPVHRDGGVERLSRGGTFLGRHIAVPLEGVAVQINAFNFPVWGMLEKMAPALLAGMPVIVKPATVTSYLAEAAFRMIAESGVLPDGAAQLIVGRTGDLLDRLGPQDVVSFTGSADTAVHLKSNENMAREGTRLVAEQDSLNASILGPDAAPGTPEFDLFLEEATREITIKAGQKCTAIRRIIVPREHADALTEALAARLAAIRPGDPADEATAMGALVSADQRADVLRQVAALRAEADLVTGSEEGDPATGLLPPMLLRCADPDAARTVHAVEAFGPVATILPYRDAAHAAALANRGRGSLVASLVTHDPAVAREIALAIAPWHGRVYVVGRDSAEEATGHGSPLPHMTHGGPGRAGGGEELGGVRGALHYMQRVAIQGSPDMLAAIGGEWVDGAAETEPPEHPFRLSFDDIEIGHTLRTPAREVTLEDIERFAHFTGDTFYAHMDEDAAAANPFFPGRVAHGYLLLSFAAGLFVQPDPGPVLANTGLNGLAFETPVRPGDSIAVRLVAKRKTRRTPAYGEVAWDVTLTDGRGDRVATYELLTMVAHHGRAGQL